MKFKKKHWFFAGFLFILFLFVLSPSASAESAKEQTYTVKAGDTLWSISEQFYGSGFSWPQIAQRNNITDPPSLPTGTTLSIPGVAQSGVPSSVTTPSPTPAQPPTPSGSQGAIIQPQTQASSKVSLEDAVYADLAIRHFLNNASIYSYDGKAEDTVSINATRQWLPASTVKTYVAMYAYNQISLGKLSPDDLVLVDAKNVVPTELVTDELPALSEGDYVSVARLIRQMITQSDNTAYNVLLDVLDRRNITDYIHSLGLTHSSLGSKLNLDNSQEQYELATPGFGINTTTAEDYGKAFSFIKDNKIPGATVLLDIFSGQKINNMIPFYLPKSLTVAHKTGDLDPLYHDGGIVKTSNRTYVLTIFSNFGDPKIVAHISDLVYTDNLNLVGVEEPNPIGEKIENQPLDPLVLNPTNDKKVLAAVTVPTPNISAADLGIKASDLSLPLTSENLPKVIIPQDSRLHFLVTTLQTVRGALSLTSSAFAKAKLDELSLRIAEAKDLRTRGKVKEANALLEQTQSQIVSFAKSSAVSSDASVQTTIQSLSDTRFSVLGDELKGAKTEERTAIIKEIADQARSTVKDVQPQIPQAGNAVNPSQKPLVGEIVSASSSTVKVRTAAGEIEVPNDAVKIKEKGKQPNVALLSSVKAGTTVALLGTSKDNKFVPSFVLTNVPKEVIAPVPVTILKVDTKKKILVVSQNGLPVQVNLTEQAVIKGADTNVSITSIKPGDIVVVHKEEETSGSQPAQAQPPVIFHPVSGGNAGGGSNSQGGSSGSGSNGQSGGSTSQGTGGGSGSSQGSLGGSSGVGGQGGSSSSGTSTSSHPSVIQSNSVQVVEKKQDVQSQPAAQQSTSSQPSSGKKNEDKDKGKGKK